MNFFKLSLISLGIHFCLHLLCPLSLWIVLSVGNDGYLEQKKDFSKIFFPIFCATPLPFTGNLRQFLLF